MIIKMMECLHFVQPFCHGGNVPEGHDDNDGDIDDDDVEHYDDDDGYPANPHHDKIPPWGEFVINGHGGILSSAYSHH